MHAKPANLLVELCRRVAESVQAFWQRRSSVNEIAGLDPQEVTRVARDLGISADELRILASRNGNAADLFVRRMQTIGLDPSVVDLAVLRDLQRCCSNCIDKVRCVHELEDKPRDPTWPKYCPNEHTLAALTEEQATRIGPQPHGR